MSLTQLLKNQTFQIIFIFYSGLLLFLGRVNYLGLRNFDDAHYAQVAKEILTTGSVWILHFNGLQKFEKPPLPFWLMALSSKLFGVSEHSVIFPLAVCGVLTVFLTYKIAELLFKDRWVAFFAAFILLFPGYFFSHSRRVTTDIILTFCVTGASFSLLKALVKPRHYLFFGLFTASAILSKGLPGLLPLLIGPGFLLLTKRSKEFLNPYFVAGILIALAVGLSWHVINWLQFGDHFLKDHFGLGIEKIIHNRDNPLYVFGYVRYLWHNYWPWLPFAVIGLAAFGKKAVREKDSQCLFILLWIAVFFVIMSAIRFQTLRYILPIFPAMAILVAKTIGDWLSEERREQFLPYMVGIIMALVLLINATVIETKRSSSLRTKSVAIKNLAPVVKLNTAPGEEIMNYRLSPLKPRNTLLFYGDRFIAKPVSDPQILRTKMLEQPKSTWLTTVKEFKQLKSSFPGTFYLIQSWGKYAYFTSQQNRDNVRYDFSGGDVNK